MIDVIRSDIETRPSPDGTATNSTTAGITMESISAAVRGLDKRLAHLRRKARRSALAAIASISTRRRNLAALRRHFTDPP